MYTTLSKYDVHLLRRQEGRRNFRLWCHQGIFSTNTMSLVPIVVPAESIIAFRTYTIVRLQG